MSVLASVLFWMITIGAGFVNPLISFGLIILYYLPEIIHNACTNHTEPKMKSFSKETLEGLR